MKNLISNLKQICEHRRLVTIEREEFEGVESIQGIVLGFSKELISILLVQDFCVNGRIILRKADDSRIYCKDIDEFHQNVMKADGVDAKLCKVRGDLVSLFMTWKISAEAKIDTPEFEPSLANVEPSITNRIKIRCNGSRNQAGKICGRLA